MSLNRKLARKQADSHLNFGLVGLTLKGHSDDYTHLGCALARRVIPQLVTNPSLSSWHWAKYMICISKM